LTGKNRSRFLAMGPLGMTSFIGIGMTRVEVGIVGRMVSWGI
jgi:hypothetical protein